MKHPYATEIRSLLKCLKRHGFSPTSVWDGEESIKTATQKSAAETILSVDQSTLRLSNGKRTAWIWVILGNGPGEAPSDYSGDCPELDVAITEHYNRWD
jgi:hypothetical protein